MHNLCLLLPHHRQVFVGSRHFHFSYVCRNNLHLDKNMGCFHGTELPLLSKGIQRLFWSRSHMVRDDVAFPARLYFELYFWFVFFNTSDFCCVHENRPLLTWKWCAFFLVYKKTAKKQNCIRNVTAFNDSWHFVLPAWGLGLWRETMWGTNTAAYWLTVKGENHTYLGKVHTQCFCLNV